MVAKHVSKSASRALGLVISKFKAFEHLYKTVQCSSVEYDQLWSCEKGGRRFSCINAIQNRAARYFMVVGSYTLIVATIGDIRWSSTDVKQWDTVLNHLYRLKSMDESRNNFKVFKWAVENGNNRF